MEPKFYIINLSLQLSTQTHVFVSDERCTVSSYKTLSVTELKAQNVMRCELSNRVHMYLISW